MLTGYIENILLINKHDSADHLKVLEKFYRNLQKPDSR